MKSLNQSIHDLILFSIKTIIVFVFVILLAFIASSIFFGGLNQAQDRAQQQLSVTGEAERKITPDSVSITLGKNIRGTNIAEIQTKAADSVNSLLDKLKNLGIQTEEIKTSNYNLNPVYDTNGDIKSYAVNVGVTVTLERKNPETTLVSKIISAATETGIDEVRSLNFYLANSNVVARELEADAIADAKSLAEKRASLAGARLGKVVNVSFGGGYPYPIYNERAVAADAAKPTADAGSSITINPGQFDLKATVTIVYELN